MKLKPPVLFRRVPSYERGRDQQAFCFSEREKGTLLSMYMLFSASSFVTTPGGMPEHRATRTVLLYGSAMSCHSLTVRIRTIVRIRTTVLLYVRAVADNGRHFSQGILKTCRSHNKGELVGSIMVEAGISLTSGPFPRRPKLKLRNQARQATMVRGDQNAITLPIPYCFECDRGGGR